MKEMEIISQSQNIATEWLSTGINNMERLLDYDGPGPRSPMPHFCDLGKFIFFFWI